MNRKEEVEKIIEAMQTNHERALLRLSSKIFCEVRGDKVFFENLSNSLFGLEYGFDWWLRSYFERQSIKKIDYEYVYLFTDGEHYKIGYTKDIKKRLSSINTGNAKNIEIVDYIIGSKSIEKKLHKKFDHLKIKGEWFLKDNEILEYFKSTYGNGQSNNIRWQRFRLSEVPDEGWIFYAMPCPSYQVISHMTKFFYQYMMKRVNNPDYDKECFLFDLICGHDSHDGEDVIYF